MRWRLHKKASCKEQLCSVRHKAGIVSAPCLSVPLGWLPRHTPQAKSPKPKNSFLNKWKPESPYKLTFCTQQKFRCRPQKGWANPKKVFLAFTQAGRSLSHMPTCRSRPQTDIGNLIMLVHHRCLPTPRRHKKSITKHYQSTSLFFFFFHSKSC